MRVKRFDRSKGGRARTTRRQTARTICHMLVSPETAAATLRHEATLYFCSRDCLERFILANGIDGRP